MLKFFVFESRRKTKYIASFLSDSCFSVAQIAKISLLAVTVASLDNHLVLHAHCNCRPLFFIVIWCIVRQVDRNGETVKHFHNCIKVLSQFRTPYCTNLRQHSERPKRCAWQCTNTKLTIFASNFCDRKLRIFAAVCCNSHVQENMLSSIRFTSIQVKTKSRFQNLGCHCKILGCHFDTHKRLKNTGFTFLVLPCR